MDINAVQKWCFEKLIDLYIQISNLFSLLKKLIESVLTIILVMVTFAYCVKGLSKVLGSE
jgi:hypothetical protein